MEWRLFILLHVMDIQTLSGNRLHAVPVFPDWEIEASEMHGRAGNGSEAVLSFPFPAQPSISRID